VAFTRGRDQWPTVKSLTLEAFRSFIDAAAVDAAALETLSGDLYLAAAAAAGHDDAVRVFDSQLLSELPRWLSRLRLTEDLVEEVRQQLRAKLLVGPPPKLAQYRASGPLAAWVRMAAVRTALDMCEADPAMGGRLRTGSEPLLDALDQEQRLIRSKYGGLVEEALRDAVKRLSKRDRNLLRFHYIAGMTFEAIARTYHVNRSTAVRWLTAIRDDLETAVRIRLWDELGISPTEVQSLWHAVRSDVEVSISRLLAGE
jgi:RNA polymerase sigma-70 factor (ECF subfamily)